MGSSTQSTPATSTKALLMMAFILTVVAGAMLYQRDSNKSSVLRSPQQMTQSSEDLKTTNTQKEFIEIKINASANQYIPGEISIKKGVPVLFTLQSIDHDYGLKFEELPLEIPLTKKGSSQSQSFIPEQSGEYIFYNPVPVGESFPMKGKLIVREE